MKLYSNQENDLISDRCLTYESPTAESDAVSEAGLIAGLHSSVKIIRISCERLPTAAAGCFHSPSMVRAFVFLLSAPKVPAMLAESNQW